MRAILLLAFLSVPLTGLLFVLFIHLSRRSCAIHLGPTCAEVSRWQTLMSAFSTTDYRAQGCIKLLSIVLLVDTESKE